VPCAVFSVFFVFFFCFFWFFLLVTFKKRGRPRKESYIAKEEVASFESAESTSAVALVDPRLTLAHEILLKHNEVIFADPILAAGKEEAIVLSLALTVFRGFRHSAAAGVFC
jgi:hypothetical protein